MKTTLLVYRDNATWRSLKTALQTHAERKAIEHDSSQLVVKIFVEGTEECDISSWFEDFIGNHDCIYIICDETAMVAINPPGEGISYDTLVKYLNFQFGEKGIGDLSLDELYRALYTRVAHVIKPDLWAIVTSNLTDYDPFEILHKESGTEEETQLYVEQFKKLIPSDQHVEVFEKCDLGVAKNKKVVFICHHHAFPSSEATSSEKCVIHLNTYPADLIPQVRNMLSFEFAFEVDILERIRTRLLEVRH